MHYSSRSLLRAAAALLLAALALAACSPGGGSQTAAQPTKPTAPTPGEPVGSRLPPWMFAWFAPNSGISQSVSLADAYAQAGKVFHNNSGTPLTPAATDWLASGPTFGMAAVQLDPAGTYVDLVTVQVDPSTKTWTGFGGTLLPFGNCGISASATDGPLTFPLKVCQGGNGGKYATASNPDRYADTFWTAGKNAFILYRWNPIDLRPTPDATSLKISGHPAWITTHQAYTSIVVQMKSNETVLFSGTASPATIQKLTEEALTDLDKLVPLLDGPPTPPGMPPTPGPSATPGGTNQASPATPPPTP
ncbi:MAG TPA: hypothetical protein VKT82_33140 [Ktedonobacterales bacterium]|nr:hypothetical protein [Ktedonobacterales bacterium]